MPLQCRTGQRCRLRARPRLPALALALLALVILDSITSAAAQEVRPARTPNGGLQPQAVVDSKGAAHLVYLKGDPAHCDVFYSRRVDGSTAFTVPMRVNDVPGSAIALGTVRGAQLAVGSNGRVHVVWNGSQSQGNGVRGAPMLYARLDSTGRRFEPQRNLMTSTIDLDGGGSVAVGANGRVYVFWHGHAKNGPDDEVHRGVYLALSTDDGSTFASEQRVAVGGVCACCGLKAFATGTNIVAVVYRSADDQANRDSRLLVSADAGQSFRSVLLGPWHISACPMSTPALGLDPSGALFAMWETEGQVYRGSFLPQTLAPPVQALPAGGTGTDRKHPAFAFSRGREPFLLTTWTEGTGWAKGGSLAWECIDLTRGAKRTGAAAGVPPWTFPAVVPEADGSFTILY